MNEVVLDASALLALLEEGANKVQGLLSRSIISSVNFAEVVTRLAAIGMPKEEIRTVLSILGLVIVPFDDEQAYFTGEIYPQTSHLGLSLGDRACLALAHIEGHIAITTDRAWAKLDSDLKVELIR
ncbi:MAG: type II toxin-antitoxin system VapC family toxin [Anaerolineales bacterium]|nr:type II toxin-antitoxin system VapC family toxin [Anaerolineales bacterium]